MIKTTLDELKQGVRQAAIDVYPEDKSLPDAMDLLIGRAYALGRQDALEAMKLPYHASMTTAELHDTEAVRTKAAENRGWNMAIEAMAKLRDELKKV